MGAKGGGAAGAAGADEHERRSSIVKGAHAAPHTTSSSCSCFDNLKPASQNDSRQVR